MGDNEDDPLTFAKIMDVAEITVENNREEFDGEMPDHGARLIVQRAADILGTQTNVELAEGMDQPFEDEERKEGLEEDVIDVILAIGAFVHENDLDVESAFEERIELMEAYNEAEDMQAFMEEMFPEEMEEMGVDVGDNVDAEGYEPENVDRTFS
ncbi:hypothetical protein [Natrinema sp. DC36]|uniref:hypothetical protein n=1 Tax=Natrinema sp. DC36 TaxID=2878680 RepID=UPI001CF0501D|nr:hypothetical protein [Natrinema sp. DC36]